MEMSGEFKIPAVKQQVWDALNNPEILKKALPGCEKLHMVSNTEFDSVVSTKLGPVRARFEAKVKLSDIEPPNSYKISIEGRGGPAGFASGTALVNSMKMII